MATYSAWQCGCTPPVIRPMDDPGPCPSCGLVAPAADAAPPAPTMPDDQRARLLGLVEWLDAETARRPGIIATPVGAGLSLLLDAAKRDPDATYRQLVDGQAAIDGMVRWVRDAVPPDVSYLDRLIGPAPQA